MTPREIRTTEAQVPCAVCGRTLLRGEDPHHYLVAGERREVCELCTGRAEREGWIRQAEGAQIGARLNGRDRRGLISRIRRRRREQAPAEPLATPDPQLVAELRNSPYADQDLLGALHEERHVHAVPTSDQLKIARALELFNVSEHPRTVAGVARSLGAPAVTIRPVENSSVVTLTVAWELCWYRYEVDLADERGGVRVADQGYELADLERDEQIANAAADDRGVLQAVAA